MVVMQQVLSRLVDEALGAALALGKEDSGIETPFVEWLDLLTSTLANDFYVGKNKFGSAVTERALFKKVMEEIGENAETADILFEKVVGEHANLLLVAARKENANKERASRFCNALFYVALQEKSRVCIA